jgi:glutamine amidotransferase
MNTRVLLVDAGTGNLRSVQHALQTLGADVLRTDKPTDLKQGGHIVMPGVGAFGGFMAGLQARGLSDVICQVVQRGDPVLGICVGMQALFDTGLELGEFAGLGLIPGKVVMFPVMEGMKIPHTGWNQFWPTRHIPLLDGLEDGEFVYFNHSFYCSPANQEDIAAKTDYGLRFASIVQRENLFGTQFHPEKSQRVGLALLANFLRLA